MANDGLYNKFELIDSCIMTLGTMRISIKDMQSIGKPVADVIQRLSVLKKGLQEEERKVKEFDCNSKGENVHGELDVAAESKE